MNMLSAVEFCRFAYFTWIASTSVVQTRNGNFTESNEKLFTPDTTELPKLNSKFCCCPWIPHNSHYIHDRSTPNPLGSRTPVCGTCPGTAQKMSWWGMANEEWDTFAHIPPKTCPIGKIVIFLGETWLVDVSWIVFPQVLWQIAKEDGPFRQMIWLFITIVSFQYVP